MVESVTRDPCDPGLEVNFPDPSAATPKFRSINRGEADLEGRIDPGGWPPATRACHSIKAGDVGIKAQLLQAIKNRLRG